AAPLPSRPAPPTPGPASGATPPPPPPAAPGTRWSPPPPAGCARTTRRWRSSWSPATPRRRPPPASRSGCGRAARGGRRPAAPGPRRAGAARPRRRAAAPRTGSWPRPRRAAPTGCSPRPARSAGWRRPRSGPAPRHGGAVPARTVHEGLRSSRHPMSRVRRGVGEGTGRKAPVRGRIASWGPERRRRRAPDGEEAALAFRVSSEIGRLRQVLVHRPDLELQRLSPSNKDALLFDDVLWVDRAREEHDLFVRHLRDRGVVEIGRA